jgi:putative SOS response-associated peptidase YedK
MCGRFTMTAPDVGELAAALGAEIRDEDAVLYRPRFNVAPTDRHLVVEMVSGHLRLVPARWGLLADGRAPHFNARSETAAERPRFREAYHRSRCVVPADGFFEWGGTGRDRHPTWFHAPARGDGGLPILRFAGLYEETPSGRTFTVLTTRANDLVAPLHDRMPVLLSEEGATRWLSAPDSSLFAPAPDGWLSPRPVSDRVNAVRHDDPECIAPSGPRKGQLRLL